MRSPLTLSHTIVQIILSLKMFGGNHAYFLHQFQCSCSQCCMAGATSRVNVALNRPTWESSVYCSHSGTCYYANKANDGITTTSHFVAPGCAHTRGAGELNPWIAIDLGVAICVDSVDVTSRGDCCGEYFL